MEIKELKDKFGYESSVSLQIMNERSKVIQISTFCLSQNSYIICSGNECAIVDPMRDSEGYLGYIKENGLVLKYILMSHTHADFVSGHLQVKNDYKQIWGGEVEIVYGPYNKAKYEVTQGEDQRVFKLNNLEIILLHTPGHTMDSVCYLFDNNILFTGDTVFLGEVGRPDLVATLDLSFTKEIMAQHLYHSIQKIKLLSDHLIILSGHGAGSPCGKKISAGLHSTLFLQKTHNYAFNLNQEEFIESITFNLPPPQNWFTHNVHQNLDGYTLTQNVLTNVKYDIDINQVQQMLQQNTSIKLLDCRYKKDVLQDGFIANSIGVYIDSSLIMFLGQLLNSHDQFIIITDIDKQQEILTRFLRIGYENIIGFVNNFKEYKGEFMTIDQIESQELVKLQSDDQIQDNKIQILDVRKMNEYEEGHLENSVLYQMDWIHQRNVQQVQKDLLKHFDSSSNIYVHCRSGMRSAISVQYLKQNLPFLNFVNVIGGYVDLQKHNAKITK